METAVLSLVCGNDVQKENREKASIAYSIWLIVLEEGESCGCRIGWFCAATRLVLIVVYWTKAVTYWGGVGQYADSGVRESD